MDQFLYWTAVAVMGAACLNALHGALFSERAERRVSGLVALTLNGIVLEVLWSMGRF